MSKRIAVIGVGLMGSSLARHLVSAGYTATVIDFHRDLADIRT